MGTPFSVIVDTMIYDDTVISKAVYWHINNYIIERKANGNSETIIFQAKNSILEEERENVLAKFNQDLNDYKLRQIIADETKDVNTILYVKAFANNDDFEEYE